MDAGRLKIVESSRIFEVVETVMAEDGREIQNKEGCC